MDIEEVAENDPDSIHTVWLCIYKKNTGFLLVKERLSHIFLRR